MRREIPQAVIAVVAEVVSNHETHATMDGLFMYAGAPGNPPEGSKHAKALAWIRNVNRAQEVENPLRVLGRLIEAYMERQAEPGSWGEKVIPERRARLEKVLASCGLQYINGGTVVVAGLAAPSRTLDELIKARDFDSIGAEFERALRSVDISPRDAVSAACNIIESFCKTYIEEEGLEMPAKQDLQPVWAVVRKHLGIDPSRVEDRDLQEIMSGLIAVASGIGALRTHASSAHGAGKRGYKLEPRHARLAVHAAHTLVLFLLESWTKKKGGGGGT